ncbi:hypothetical protein VE02_01222 [Pseudogymnoascus sp. 03VT05]|nr:hypothetical protein VE02_01222 [Pseudogymnoascus sp. 03VT05]
MTSEFITRGVSEGASARVSIIDNTFLYDIPVDNYIQPVVPGYENFSLPSYAFLVENSEGRKVLFDLALRKDWQNLAPEALHEIEADGIKIVVERDVIDILDDEGVKGADIEAVVFSHHHWDHIGDMSRFPSSTDVIVGPGFTKAFIPGYPANPESPVKQTDYENHNLREIDFADPKNQIVNVGAFRGYDYFGDGSFYLLDAPGHSIGHICALARTTTSPNTFVFMGADACHHNGEFRPSVFHPLPTSILPNPLTRDPVHACPGESWAKYLKAKGRSIETPFFDIPDVSAGPAYTHDVQASLETINKVQDTDADTHVLVIFAHDESIKGIVDFYPKSVNEWKAKEWGTVSRWAFLKDFRKVFDDAN